MKKILIFLALLIGLMWSVTFVLLPKIESKIESMTPIESTEVNNQEIQEEILPQQEEIIDNKEIVRNKIEMIRKRLALKGLIIEGDSYYRDGQLTLALKKYLDFYKKNPEDQLIIEKLGDTYFEMKKFSSAYNYYARIYDSSENIKEKAAKSLFLMTKLDDQNSIESTKTKLLSLDLDAQKLLYYETSLSCLSDFHICKKQFGNYFWPTETEKSGTGTIHSDITYAPLSDIKNAIVNYQNFQVDDVYLKDAYIIGAWYSNGLYNMSAFMGQQLLKEKINYKPIIKIIAQSYFELGIYDASRDALISYYELDDDDMYVTYLLGVVNSKLREYVLANIYFNKALELGYPDASNIYRQLIHNFYSLENDTSMLKSFASLIENNNFTQNDLSLGIYNHIIHEQYPQALLWAKKGQELFSENTGRFHAYEGWILNETGEYDASRTILKQGLTINPDDPFILINYGYNALARGAKGEALIHFKKILTISQNSEFADNASEEIKKLSSGDKNND